MKILRNCLMTVVVSFPLILSAQSVTGDWKTEVPGPDGNSINFKVSMKSDGTYTVDFGQDGTIEISGSYQVDGDQMTIQDTGGAQACTSGKGVYKIEISGNSLTMTRISDSCEGRGGPTGVMSFTKA